MTGKTAWVAGASGLIGRQLCEQLCANESFDAIYAFVRNARNQPLAHEKPLAHKKLHYIQCDWEEIRSDLAVPTGLEPKVDALFCALGSTKKKTPDKQAYRRIDVEYPVAFAKLGHICGARYYGFVSAHGASSTTPSFYLNMKADAEAQLKQLDFEHLAIARPSLLLGEREEFRLMEKASEWVCKRLPGDLKAIKASDVAAALIREALSSGKGSKIISSSAMQGASSL